jgi:hypothetical protein
MEEVYIQGENKMMTKYVTVKVSYDTEETWNTTLQEVKEIFQMMNNLKRHAIIIDINQDEEEIHRGFKSKL